MCGLRYGTVSHDPRAGLRPGSEPDLDHASVGKGYSRFPDVRFAV